VPLAFAENQTYREQCGNPASGVMFASSKGTPLNLNNVLNRSILPALRKAGCEWHGWHAFRRGPGTNLYRLGVPDKTIQAILRHANVSTTMNIYVKSVSADSTAAMKLLETALCANCAPVSAPGTATVVN
jgi:integrase